MSWISTRSSLSSKRFTSCSNPVTISIARLKRPNWWYLKHGKGVFKSIREHLQKMKKKVQHKESFLRNFDSSIVLRWKLTKVNKEKEQTTFTHQRLTKKWGQILAYKSARRVSTRWRKNVLFSSLHHSIVRKHNFSWTIKKPEDGQQKRGFKNTVTTFNQGIKTKTLMRSSEKNPHWRTGTATIWSFEQPLQR